MSFMDILEESISVLRTNRLRTGLSALGIIIGVGSVIALMSLGQASQASVKQRIQSLGSNLLMVRPGAQREGFLRGAQGGVRTLTEDDAKAIKSSDRITTVESVAAEFNSRAQVTAEVNNSNLDITGISGDYFKLRNVEVISGVGLTESDNLSVLQVAVLGPSVTTDLFGENVSPIGKQIKINGNAFKVVGVTKAKGGSGFGNQDEVIYIPLSTAQKVLFGANYVSSIYIGAKSEQVMSAAQNQVGFLLLERHRKQNPEEADFSIQSQEEILQTVSSVTNTFTMLLTGIAAISLIVGGIGIMNIMLVTVTERTTEIGLRKALGAKRKNIITQFLTESIVLTVFGGLIGVAIGIGTSMVMTKAMSLPNAVSLVSIGLAVVVSSAIGIIFGWYPAYKASKLQPIEALRYE